MPLVSVVVPTRNRSALLRLTLLGVLRQRDVDLEVIVVDEASTDDTPAVLAGLGDARIRVIRHDTPRGVSTARNRGAADARSEWVAFLDDDDLWAPDKLALQVSAALQNGCSWAYVGHVNVNMDHRVTGGASPLPPDVLIRELPRHNVVPGGCSGVLVSKRAFAAAGCFDPGLQPLADWDLWLRLAAAGRPACVSQPLVAYRLHGGQMSLDCTRVEREFAMLAVRNPAADPVVLYRYLAWWALRIGDHRQALRLFIRAWRQRRPGYAAPALAADLAQVATAFCESKLALPVAAFRTTIPFSDDVRMWRAEGQAWVNELIASAETARGSAATVRPG